jgi:hypothetical protein
MASFIDPTPSEPYSDEELELVEIFIRDQAAVVMRADRMEMTRTPHFQATKSWLSWFSPWLENQRLRAEVEAYRQGNALQLILEQQLLLALTYLNDPEENTREDFVSGSFKAIYACERYRYGEVASRNIVNVVHRLGLQDFW